MNRFFLLSLILSLIISPAIAQKPKTEEPASRDFVVVGETLDKKGTTDKSELPELWGLVVGVSDYKFGNKSGSDVHIKNLRYAARDADAIYRFLISENGGFQKDHVLKLTDQDATKPKVEAGLFQFLSKAREQDYVFIFFASHGAYSPDQSGPGQTPYLILYDTDPQKIAETGLGVDVISKALKQIKAKKGLFVSDACHSGGLEFAGGRSSSDEARVRNALREQVAGSKDGIAYLSAANSVEKSYESPDLEHGIFTYYMLEGLRGQARGKERNVVTVRDLWIYVQKKVAERTDNKQHPTLGQNRYDPNLVVSVFPRTVDDAGATGSVGFGTLLITVRDEDQVEITIDGKQIPGNTLDSNKSVSLPLSPGSHSVKATKGSRIFKKDITINPGKTTNLPIRLPLPIAEPSAKTKAKFQEGVALYEQFKLDDAIKRFNEAVAMEPAFPDSYAYIGRSEMRAGRPERAVAAYDKALELDPTNTRMMALKAEALLEKGDIGGAEELLKQAVAEDIEDGFAPLVLGYTYYFDDRYEEAQNYLQTSINRDPTNPMGYLQMSYVLQALRDREGAEAAARKAIQLFNEFPKEQEKTSAWKSVFMSTKIRKFFDENGLADAHLRLGVLLLEKAVGDASRGTDQSAMSEAVANLEKAQKYAQSSGNKYLLAQAIYYRSEIYAKNQDFDQAIKGFQQALQNNGELAQPYRGLSWCYEKQQKFNDALNSYQKFMERLNKSDLEKDQAQIERRLKRLQELARAHAKK
jgi:uncharacterized caspase-like protein/tetratricopeptide (TPR) repeat protein